MTTETKNADTLTSSATDLAKYNYLIFVILSTERFIICKIGGEKLLIYRLKNSFMQVRWEGKEGCVGERGKGPPAWADGPLLFHIKSIMRRFITMSSDYPRVSYLGRFNICSSWC